MKHHTRSHSLYAQRLLCHRLGGAVLYSALQASGRPVNNSQDNVVRRIIKKQHWLPCPIIFKPFSMSLPCFAFLYQSKCLLNAESVCCKQMMK